MKTFGQDDGNRIRYEGYPYSKIPSTVYMEQQEEEFSVETIEGTMHGNAGDWLVYDPKSTHVWVITSDYQKMHYRQGSLYEDG